MMHVNCYKKKLLVAGHSFIKEENRAPFRLMTNFDVTMVQPKKWGLFSEQNNKLKTSDNCSFKNKHISTLGKKNHSFFIWNPFQLWKEINSTHLIYCWQEPWSLAAFEFSILSLIFNKPFFLFSAENCAAKFNLIRKILSAFPLMTAYGLIVINSDSKKIYENHRNKYRLKFSINRIPLWSEFKPLPIPPSYQAKLFFIGRLIPLKNTPPLLHCLKELQSNFSLELIGNGPEKKSLIQLSQELQLENRVHFRGFANRQTLSNTLQTGGILILITQETEYQKEQFGKVVLEAILHGLPVIVSQSGFLKQWHNMYNTVYLYNTNEPISSLISLILKIQKSPPKRSDLIKNAQHAFNEYGLKTSSERFEKLFNQLFSKEPKT